MWLVIRAPFVPIGAFATRPMTSWPSFRGAWIWPEVGAASTSAGGSAAGSPGVAVASSGVTSTPAGSDDAEGAGSGSTDRVSGMGAGGAAPSGGPFPPGARRLLLRLLLGRALVQHAGVFALGELELLREVRVAVDVADVEEGSLFEADVHEGRLHAGEHPDHAALGDVSDDALLALSLEIELVDRAAFDECDARLSASRVDDEGARA